MSDAMDAVQDLVLVELEQRQAMRLAQIAPVPNLRLGAVYCLDCGERVDPRRVRAMPNCQRCVDCQTRSEHRRIR